VILIHQRHRQTDRQTDGRHAISIPRYALVHRAVKSIYGWRQCNEYFSTLRETNVNKLTSS